MWIEIQEELEDAWNAIVTPYAGVWIEISLYALRCIPAQVTPYAGVWIEIVKNQKTN